MKKLEEVLQDWEAVIGLEIHAELTTLNTKMFCGCKLEFGAGAAYYGDFIHIFQSLLCRLFAAKRHSAALAGGLLFFAGGKVGGIAIAGGGELAEDIFVACGFAHGVQSAVCKHYFLGHGRNFYIKSKAGGVEKI